MTPAEVDQLFLADVNKDGRLNEEELLDVSSIFFILNLPAGSR